MSVLSHKSSVAVLGLGFGDEGKGASIDALARHRGSSLVVRFNGGSQAAHHVVTPEGGAHCFSQFGAATLATRARTFLSRFVVVDPLGLKLEALALEKHGVKDPLSLVHVDPAAILTTPFHKLLGRAREFARGQRHGSCGKGIGIAWLDQRAGKPGVTWGDLHTEGLRAALKQVRDEKLEEVRQLEGHLDDSHQMNLEAISLESYLDILVEQYNGIKGRTAPRLELPDPSKVLFEGAQGALLDADLGFFPHVTPSNTGAKNALTLAQEFGWDHPLCVGVLRAYSSRHGAGPFIVGDRNLVPYLMEAHNETGEWQGPMRVGWFDVVAARYGLQIAEKVDGVMITHLDRMAGWPEIGVCEAWQVRQLPKDFPPTLRRAGRLTSLPMLKGSLEQRARWSEHIAGSYPNIHIMKGWKDAQDPNLAAYLDWIKVELEMPIFGTAFGPTWKDQSWA